MANKDFKVKNGLDIQSPLPVSMGGTGQTSTTNALNSLLPLQTSNANKVLITDGTNASWASKGAAYASSAPSSPNIGDLWVDSGSAGDSADPYIIRRKTITATAGQTVFTTDVTFTDGYEQVYYNGVLLVRTTDYTTSGGTNTVTLIQGASAGDTVEILSTTPITSVNTLTTTGSNTITNTNSSSTPLTVIAASSQNVDIITAKNSIGNTIFSVTSDGSLSTPVASRFGNSQFGGDFGGAVELGVYSTIDKYSYIDFHGVANNANDYDARIIRDPAAGGGLTIANNGTGGLHIKTQSNSSGAGAPIYFYTDSVERMRIDSSGNVGIGTSSPAAKLDVYGALIVNNNGNMPAQNGVALGTVNKATAPSGNQGAFQVYSNDPAASQLQAYMTLMTDPTATNRRLTFGVIEQGTGYRNITFVENGGNVLVGYSASQGAYKLQVNSQIFATSSTIATSDGRYKDNVETLSGGLNIIDSLRPVSFNWKEHAVHNFPEGKTVGFIAQEVQETLAGYDWVDNIIKSNYNEETEEEFLGIAEGNIIPLLVAAVKELKSDFEEYKSLHP